MGFVLFGGWWIWNTYPISEENEIPTNGISEGAPMTIDQTPLCDFNNDGNCDSEDLQIFNRAIGSCSILLPSEQ